MYDLLRQKAKGLERQMVDFAAELARGPSPIYEERSVANIVEEMMKRLRYDEVFKDDAGNIVGILLGRKTEPALLLCSHMDTVSSNGAVSRPPPHHKGHRESGNLYGLNTSDRGAGIAAQVFACALLKRSVLPLEGSIVVAATAGERTESDIGLRTLIEQTLPSLHIKPTFAVLGEPTDMGLYYGHNGWTELEISTCGIDPLRISNATSTIRADTAHRHGQNDNNHESRTAGPPAFRASRESGGSPRIMNNLAHLDNNATVAASLSAPSFALLHQHVQTEERIVNAWSIDPYHPLMEQSRHALAAAGCNVRPGKWRDSQSGVATSGSALTETYDIPTIGYGPGNEKQVHVADESVNSKNLAEATYGTAIIAQSLVGIPVWGWSTNDF